MYISLQSPVDSVKRSGELTPLWGCSLTNFGCKRVLLAPACCVCCVRKEVPLWKRSIYIDPFHLAIKQVWLHGAENRIAVSAHWSN